MAGLGLLVRDGGGGGRVDDFLLFLSLFFRGGYLFCFCFPYGGGRGFYSFTDGRMSGLFVCLSVRERELACAFYSLHDFTH